ncbi:hypothetical protein BJ912DRAFT_1001995 [Pholiota molesta]|nr:hypothetical protein BJ912DRAFT_1001995 [Pholiota molesta]
MLANMSAGLSAFEKLQNASAPNAFHNSSVRFDPPKCHPNTRVAVLEYLMGWIFGRNDPEALILWLYGPAGAGKSAILQTIAECCFERGSVLASFFFGRSDPSRNTFKPLVATIAYQIATTIPEIKLQIERAIEHDPLLFEKSLATQLQCLIVEPLRGLAASGFFDDPSNCARLVLIDGLDECDDPRMQSMILRILANALRNEKLPLIFLIASRPEQHITLTFNSPPLAGLWRSLVLDDSYKPDDDIRLFLEDSFRDIKTTHPHRHLIPEAWPEPWDVDMLVQKSSGQFIYSSVVVKYISAPLDRPPRRLDVIMGLRPARGDVPFSELDALYTHILGSCADPNTVLSILGVVMTFNTSNFTETVDSVEIHLDMEPGDVEIFLAPLASIITIRKSEYDTHIELRHASFTDFLVDISRSGPFYIDTLSTKEHLLSKCISKLMNPDSIICDETSVGTLLETLAHPFYPSRIVQLTETVESALKSFSLPQFWSIWPMGPHGTSKGARLNLVYIFLNFLTGRKNVITDTIEVSFHRALGFSTIYTIHLSSFESIIESELLKYRQDVGLMSLVVISLLDSDRATHFLMSQTTLVTLLRLTEDSKNLDNDSLWLVWPYGRYILAAHYRHMFVEPKRFPELFLDGEKHAQVALRLLEYLCDHLPHSIPYRKRQTPRTPSHYVGTSRVSTRSFHSLLSRGRLTGNSFLRKRREKKHRYGATLSIPDTSQPSGYLFSSAHDACAFGLLLLPDILERSSSSPELATFIRRHGSNIAFLPKKTRKAIRAMHEYLDRSDEEGPMTQLCIRFAAMAIE